MNNHLLAISLALTLVVGFSLVASNDVAASKSPYRSGYDHGAGDARDDCSDGCDWYILEPGKGFEFHTQEFIDGYIDGFCDNSPPGVGVMLMRLPLIVHNYFSSIPLRKDSSRNNFRNNMFFVRKLLDVLQNLLY